MNWKKETEEHISRVKELVYLFIDQLKAQVNYHDQSKFESPEKEIFKKYTSKLKDTTYGSDKYKQYLKEMKPALDHHYKFNSHHPESFSNGIKGMNLIDIIEMFFDWKAATERHADGDIIKSISINKERFKYGDILESIFKNTINNYTCFQKEKNYVN